MQFIQQLGNLEFYDEGVPATPLMIDGQTDRILRFTLRPGQSIQERIAPHSPMDILILKGHGTLASADGQEGQFGPNTLLMLGTAEKHCLRAVNEALICVVFLEGTSRA